MADASAFLRKRKDKRRVVTPQVGGSPAPKPPTSSSGPLPTLPSNGLATSSSSSAPSDPSKVHEFKLYSVGHHTGVRHSMMRLNLSRVVDPTTITKPILLNRKTPGPRPPPLWAFDENGTFLGKYVYDSEGKPVLGSDGKQVIEKKAEKDMSLVGQTPEEMMDPSGVGKRRRRGVKEVFHQDIEVMRMRREENLPWVLESGNPKDEKERAASGAAPEHWVGRMIEPSSMPTVLLVNDGTMGMAYDVVPLGRTYKFDPERPFKVLDPDAAHKLYEHQSKYKIHDRWAQREGGPSSSAESSIRPQGAGVEVKQEQRALRLEQQMRTARGGDVKPKVKQERFDDDYRREGRRLERGLEGGEDEELDYDMNEDFQDDEDNNTFYRNEEEEEEAKRQEEVLKKEQRLANANVGDRPQIDSESEDDLEDDLFGGDKLNGEGKKLRKMIKKGGGVEDGYGTSESDEDSDVESVKTTDSNAKAKDKESEAANKPNAPGSERPSRPPSRGPNVRGATSPIGRKTQPSSAKASTAPPGAGSQLNVQRALSRAGSPRRSRQNSPMSLDRRSGSPEVSHQRQGSAGPSRAMSPTGSVRDGSPALSPTRPSGGGHQSGQVKRKTTSESPAPETPNSGQGQNKRKTSPALSATGSEMGNNGPSSKKPKKTAKAGSKTPTPGPSAMPDPFPGMITRQEVVDWLKKYGKPEVPMRDLIGSFTTRIKSTGQGRQEDQTAVFKAVVGELTTKTGVKGTLKVNEGIL